MAEGVKLAKRRVAELFVGIILKPRTDVRVLGVGSGSTIEEAFSPEFGLSEWIKQNKVKCVPTSFQAHQLLEKSIPQALISNLREEKTVDVAFDGADEIVLEQNLAIKGGGGCQRLEKAVAQAARELHILVDSKKVCEHLGTEWKKGIPVEVAVDQKVMPDCDFCSYLDTVRKSMLQICGDSTKEDLLKLRKCEGGKLGPIITDTGNLILDWQFHEVPTFSASKKPAVDEWKAVSKKIESIDGVVAHGLFTDLVTSCFIGKADGSVDVVVLPDKKFSFDSSIKTSSSTQKDLGGEEGAKLRELCVQSRLGQK